MKRLEGTQEIKEYIDDYDAIIAEQDPEEYIKAREAYLVYQAEFDKKCREILRDSREPDLGGGIASVR